MKAILVMGMPERCGECPLCIYDRYGYFYCGRTAKKVDKDKKSEKYPLKPIPQKKYDGKEWTKYYDVAGDYLKAQGYNQCLDELLEEEI